MTKRYYILLLFAIVTTVAWADDDKFTVAEQQQINIETPGLFDRSDAFQIDLAEIRDDGYSFPLPTGKIAGLKDKSLLQITAKEGDAVKAMFEGDVRLACNHPQYGNTIVIRHNNGLETVYYGNAQNLVGVGDHVAAGQTIATVGRMDKEYGLLFSVMVNGRKLNPESLLEENTHELRPATLKVKKKGKNVKVSISRKKEGGAVGGSNGLMAYTGEDAFAVAQSVTIRLADIPERNWAYPLPGAKLISPYGKSRGRHRHSGVDLKTKPEDNVMAAFPGKIIKSGPHYAYGNYIEIEHANGIKTAYSHMSVNIVNEGDIVKAGDVIGLTGRTGRATTEHLHFEMFCGNSRIDPSKVFDHNNHCLKDVTLKVTRKGVKIVK